MNTPRPASSKVDIKQLIKFLFPPGLQHPLVAGRLIAFGMYGPLDDNLRLHSGEKGNHVVQSYELDTMCDQFEKEDIMQVYITGKRSLATLSAVEKSEMVVGANPKTKTTRGKLTAQCNNAEVSQQKHIHSPCRRITAQDITSVIIRESHHRERSN